MYTLYYAPDNASLAVRMALEELALPYQAIQVDRSQNEQHSVAYRALNPQGQIPVLLCPEQDEPLFETAACLLYLAQRHRDATTPLWPHDAKGLGNAGGQSHAIEHDPAYGRALKWLFFLSNTLHAELKTVFYTARYLARPEADSCDNLLQGMQSRIGAHLRLIDAQLALPRKAQGAQCAYLLGENAYSVCDIYLAVCVRWALLYPVGIAIGATSLSELPHLHTLLKNLEQRPALIKAVADEGLISADAQAPRFFSAPALPLNLAAATG